MEIDLIRTFCNSLFAVTEDIKWGNDLCFSIGGKMFCVVGLEVPISVSFKVRDDQFETISLQEGFDPAPYVARYNWVLVRDVARLSRNELHDFIRQSYQLVKDRLPKKLLIKLGTPPQEKEES